MTDKRKISVFGAANVDITGFPKAELIYKDANIGTMHTAAGGVGRNIAENLHLLGFEVNLISVFGDDPLSDFLINDCQKKELNINKSLFLKDTPASTFLAVMDSHNDLAVGISAMGLYDDLNPQDFLKNLPDELPSVYSILETNFSSEILQKIVEKYPEQKFILDTVSGKKALRSLPVLDKIYILKTNLLEAEMISGIHIKTDEDHTKLVRYFLDQGVQKVFITLGKNGVIYGNRKTITRQLPIPAKVINTIGAGDAFISGLVYADSMNAPIDQMAKYGMKAAALTVSYPEAVNPALNADKLKE